jgi:alpha,alpha-trehalase
VTTLEMTGQQWDAPNGWAPLQWIAIEGLRNYGYHQLADKIKKSWVETNMRIFEEKGKLVEKYDVTSHQQGGGGEYPLQDGFGWTNGVLAALLAEDDENAF